jgi:hypothetical protein
VHDRDRIGKIAVDPTSQMPVHGTWEQPELMNAVEELEYLKRLFETWEGNGVYVSPAMRQTLMEICVRETLEAAREHARWNLWKSLR